MKKVRAVLYILSLVLLLVGVAFYIVEIATSTDKYAINTWGQIGIWSWIGCFFTGFLFILATLKK